MMELNVLEEEKQEFKFELKGEDNTFSQLLLSQLLENSDVEIAYYNIPHPLAGSPVFYVRTKKDSPRAAVKDALEEIKTKIKSLRK